MGVIRVLCFFNLAINWVNVTDPETRYIKFSKKIKMHCHWNLYSTAKMNLIQLHIVKSISLKTILFCENSAQLGC